MTSLTNYVYSLSRIFYVYSVRDAVQCGIRSKIFIVSPIILGCHTLTGSTHRVASLFYNYTQSKKKKRFDTEDKKAAKNSLNSRKT